MQSVPITTTDMSLMAAHGEIYTLRDNVKNNQIIKYLIDLFLIHFILNKV